MEIRVPQQSEVEALAKLWHDGWQDAHAQILPEALARHRTLDSFRQRLRDGLSHVRVAGPVGQPLGLAWVEGDELNQLYVAATARGTGLARALTRDAEARIRSGGFSTAWLACAIGNDRASRFYEKQGWRHVGDQVIQLDTPDGIFPLEIWRFEKDLGGLRA